MDSVRMLWQFSCSFLLAVEAAFEFSLATEAIDFCNDRNLSSEDLDAIFGFRATKFGLMPYKGAFLCGSFHIAAK